MRNRCEPCGLEFDGEITCTEPPPRRARRNCVFDLEAIPTSDTRPPGSVEIMTGVWFILDWILPREEKWSPYP